MDERQLPSNKGSEEDRRLARVLTALVWASGGLYLFAAILGLFYGDGLLIAVALMAFALLSIPVLFLRRKRVHASALAFMLSQLGVVTAIATVGQGIHDLVILAFPIIIIFAGLALERPHFRLCVGLTLIAVCWLALGETFGWFVSKPFVGGAASNWFFLVGTSLILLVAALAVDMLAGNIRRNLERAQTEITERKGIEERLEEEKILLRTLIDSLPDRIYVKDAQGTKIVSNTADWQASGGKKMEDIVGKTDFDTYPHELAAQFWALDKQVIDTGVPAIGVEEPGLDADGKPVTTVTSKVPLRNAQDQIVGLVGSGHAITARKRAEEALAWEQYLLQTLLDNLPDRIYFKDRYSRFTRISRSQADMFGLRDSAGALGKTDFDFFAEAHARPALDAEQDIMVTGQPLLGLEEQETWSDGRLTWVHTTKMPLRDKAGNITGTFGISSDITQRKRFELVQNAVFRITQAAIASEGIDSLYRSIHSILTELIPTENFYIALYDAVNDLLSFPYFVDQHDEKPAGPTKVEGLTGYVIRTGQPFLATREVLDGLVGRGQVQAVGPTGEDWMGAPLKAAGNTIGVIAMQSYAKGVHFSEADLKLLEFVSTQVAQAIERKRMEEEIRSLSLTDELTGL